MGRLRLSHKLNIEHMRMHKLLRKTLVHQQDPAKHVPTFSADYGPLFLTMVQHCSVYKVFVGNDSWVFSILNESKMSALYARATIGYLVYRCLR